MKRLGLLFRAEKNFGDRVKCHVCWLVDRETDGFVTVQYSA